MSIQLGILCVVILAGCIHTSSGQIEEKPSLKALLDDYERNGIAGRPVMNMSAPINVDVVFALIQIISFDQYNQYVTLTGRTTLQWDDEYLAWDNEPEEYSVPAGSIWTPDVHVLNAVDQPVDIHKTSLVVSSSGHVTWVRPQRLQLACVTFEDDVEPSCEIIFSSWSLNSDQMHLTAGQNRIDAGFYIPSNVWELSKTKAELGVRKYPIPGRGEKEFADVTFNFSLKRRPQEDDNDDKDKMASAGTVRASLLGSILAAVLVYYHNM